jgi:hypothetical protein
MADKNDIPAFMKRQMCENRELQKMIDKARQNLPVSTEPALIGQVQNHIPSLEQMKDFVDSVDPMTGPNLLRHTRFKDNGDGTMKLLMPLPYVRNPSR